MNKTLPFVLLVVATSFAHAEPKKLAMDFEAAEEGTPPSQIMVVEGAITVKAMNGNKVLEIGLDPLVDANALIGDSANGSATIETRVFASKAGRSYPRFGVGVHGQSGYRLIIFAAKKELQLVKNDEVIKSVPFEWKSEAWTKLKLEVKKVAEGKWSLSGKAWSADAEEPKEAQITHEDATLKGQGKCSIWGTPFAGTPISFDDIKIEVE
jgi:hypothetical protein